MLNIPTSNTFELKERFGHEDAYWSSSEVNAAQSWYEGFTLGITANDAAKVNHFYVRAIRAF